MAKLEDSVNTEVLFDTGYELVYEYEMVEPNRFYDAFLVGTDGFSWDNIADGLPDLDDLDEDDPVHDLFLIGDFVKECLRETIIVQRAKDYAEQDARMKKERELAIPSHD